MPHSHKTCLYKNCINNQRTNKESGITFFRFPNNPERKQLWMQRADVPLNTPEHRLYLCSKHFDRKFMAINKRRTVLVGQANPFSCEKDIEGIIQKTVTETATEEVEAIEPIQENIDPFEIVYTEEQNNCTPVIDMKTEEVEANQSNQKNKDHIEILYSEEQNDCTPASALESLESNDPMIDKRHVSKFICNGKVYVKMRLDYYKAEKQALLDKINEYEQIINRIRNDVQNVVTLKV